MSKHIQKYPGLYSGAKTAGISYQVAYLRVAKLGWSVERALATPVGRCGRPSKKPVSHIASLTEREAAYTAQWIKPTALTALPPWQKPGYVANKTFGPPKRKRYQPNPSKDTSPPHIRKLRAAYCAEFIKTGNLNEEMAAKLRSYAHECRTSAKHPDGVPAEPEARHQCRERPGIGNHGRRSDNQIDGDAASRIADFLRT